jgi:hypothetical protein
LVCDLFTSHTSLKLRKFVQKYSLTHTGNPSCRHRQS